MIKHKHLKAQADADHLNIAVHKLKKTVIDQEDLIIRVSIAAKLDDIEKIYESLELRKSDKI